MDLPNVINLNDFLPFFSNIKTSIRSIADNGLMLFGFFAIITIVLSVISHFSKHSMLINNGVKQRGLSREIFRSDVKHNLDDILEDSNIKKEISLLSSNRFYQKNSKLLILDKVQNMEVSHAATMLFAERNPNAYAEKRDLNYRQAQEYYKSRGHK